MSTSNIQKVNLADNVNAAVDKINENFELVETGIFSGVDSSSVTNIVNNVLDSDYFTTIINEDYITNITTNLNVDLTDVEAGIAANAASILAMEASITQTDSGITVLASQQQATQAQLEGVVLGGIDSDLLADAIANANTTLTSRIDATDSSISVLAENIDSVNSSLLLLDSSTGALIAAEGDARVALTSRVTANEGDISTVQGDITILEGKIDTVDSDGNPTTFLALATESLQTEVSRVEGLITTSATWGIDLVAGTESNPHIAGIKFGNDGATSEFAITADTFKVINASDNEIQPFTISGDQIELSNVKVTGNLDIGSNLSGARMEMKDDVTKIFDSAGQLRVQLGNLAV